MKRLFYNEHENRLRMVWRLLLGLLVLVGGQLIIQIAIGAVVGIVAMLSGVDVLDPSFAQSIMNDPALRISLAIGTLLIVVAGTWFTARFIDRRRIADYGLRLDRQWWMDFGFGLLLGAVLMVLIFGVEWAAGWITITGYFQPQGIRFMTGMLIFLVVFFCVGIYEELFSRGYLLRILAEGLNIGPINAKGAILIAYFITSSIFGLLHAGNENATLVSTLNLVIAGLFLGLGFVLTGELGISIGLHMTWNYFQGNIFGFPVSGSNAGATLVGITQGGPELWTGGAFGPEAGLIGIIAIVIGALLIAAYVRATRGSLGIAETLAIYQPRKPQPDIEQML